MTNVRIVPDVTPAQSRWLRVAAAVVGALLTGAAVVATRLGAGGGSPGAVAAAVLAALAALGCAGLAVAPATVHRPVWAAWRRLVHRLKLAPATISRPAAAVIIVIGTAGFALIVARLLSIPQNPWDDDQGAFLITAREIDEHGGITWLWRTLWSGEFSEANRHPLYLALLSLWPTVRGGQVLSVVLGAVTLALLTAGASRRCGRLTAAAFCVLLGTNGAFCLFSTRIVCEVLLVLFVGLAWMIHVPQSGAPHDRALSPGRCALGGALLGLAWLSKGTGLVLFAGYLLWIAIAGLWPAVSTYIRRVLLRMWIAIAGLWPAMRPSENDHDSPANQDATRKFRAALQCLSCAILAFLAISLPLVARNVNRFGNPFHNLNSLLLFADRYEDLGGMVERRLTTGDAAREYLATHSAADIVRREASGLVWEAFIILRSLGPAPLDDARLLFGLPLGLLAAARLATRRSATDGLLVIWGGLSWVLFAWYVPIAAGERFVLPLLAPLLLLAADTLAHGANGDERRSGRRGAAIALGWVALWVLACWLSTGFAERSG